MLVTPQRSFSLRGAGRLAEAGPPGIEGDGGRGRGVERLDVRGDRDPPPEPGAEVVGQAGAFEADERGRTVAGKGSEPISGPSVARAIRGCSRVCRSSIEGPWSNGTWKSVGPGGPGAPWGGTGARPRAAGPPGRRRRPPPSGSPRPTFSGSWNGTNSVQPSGQGASSDHSGISGTRTSRRGAWVPEMSSSRNRGSASRYQTVVSIGGAGPFVSVSHAFDPVGEPLEDLGDGPAARQEGLAVLADPPAAEQVAAELERRVRLARHLADRAGVDAGTCRSPRRGRGPPAARRRRAGGRGASPGSGRRGRPPAGSSRRATVRPRRSRRRSPAPS